MAIIDKINYIMTVVMVVLIIGVAIGGLLAFYFLKIRKKKRRVEGNVDYSSFSRKDAEDYIKTNDIKDDMIILNNNRRFVGVIKCRGFDFYSAHAAEQGATVQNFLSFINTINKPVTYRQYCKAVDMEDTYIMYKEAYDRLSEELFTVTEDLKDLLAETKGKDNSYNEAEKNLYSNMKDELERKIDALSFRKFHMEHQMTYLSNISGNKVSPEINETWVFDWSYDPMAFSVDLTEEEIFERAKKELYAIGEAKIHALSAAGVKATRCKTEDLIEMCRRYSAPISSDRYKIQDVMRSSYFADIVSSNSPKEIIKNGIETAKQESEDIFQNMLDGLMMNTLAEKEREEFYKYVEDLENHLLKEQEKQTDNNIENSLNENNINISDKEAV